MSDHSEGFTIDIDWESPLGDVHFEFDSEGHDKDDDEENSD